MQPAWKFAKFFSHISFIRFLRIVARNFRSKYFWILFIQSVSVSALSPAEVSLRKYTKVHSQESSSTTVFTSLYFPILICIKYLYAHLLHYNIPSSSTTPNVLSISLWFRRSLLYFYRLEHVYSEDRHASPWYPNWWDNTSCDVSSFHLLVSYQDCTGCTLNISIAENSFKTSSFLCFSWSSQSNRALTLCFCKLYDHCTAVFKGILTTSNHHQQKSVQSNHILSETRSRSSYFATEVPSNSDAIARWNSLEQKSLSNNDLIYSGRYISLLH